MKTDKEYVNDSGQHCPNCDSAEIEGGNIEVDGQCAWQPVTCNECNSTWNDTFQLTGFAEFEEGYDY